MADPSATPVRRGLNVPVWVFVAVGGVLLFGLAFFIGRRSDRHDRFDNGRFVHHAGHRWVGVLLLVAVVGLIVAGIVLLVRHFSTSASAPTAVSASPTASAEEVLAIRLARGEIDEVEYRQRLAALRGDS